MAPINFSHAMDKEHNEDFQESSLSSNLFRSDFVKTYESQIYTGAILGSWSTNGSLPQGTWLGESIAPEVPKSYLWGYLRDLEHMCSGISNKIPGFTWPNFPYLSSQSPSNVTPPHDLDAVVLEFHYIEDPSKEAGTDTRG